MALSITPAILLPTQLVSSSAALLFTAAGTNGVVVKKGSFANLSGGTLTLTLWRLAISDVAVANALIITPAVTLGPSAVYNAAELINLVLNTGDSLWGQASAASAITGTISGFNF